MFVRAAISAFYSASVTVLGGASAAERTGEAVPADQRGRTISHWQATCGSAATIRRPG